MARYRALAFGKPVVRWQATYDLAAQGAIETGNAHREPRSGWSYHCADPRDLRNYRMATPPEPAIEQTPGTGNDPEVIRIRHFGNEFHASAVTDMQRWFFAALLTINTGAGALAAHDHHRKAAFVLAIAVVAELFAGQFDMIANLKMAERYRDQNMHRRSLKAITQDKADIFAIYAKVATCCSISLFVIGAYLGTSGAP